MVSLIVTKPCSCPQTTDWTGPLFPSPLFILFPCFFFIIIHPWSPNHIPHSPHHHRAHYIFSSAVLYLRICQKTTPQILLGLLSGSTYRTKEMVPQESPWLLCYNKSSFSSFQYWWSFRIHSRHLLNKDVSLLSRLCTVPTSSTQKNTHVLMTNKVKTEKERRL